MPAERHTRKNVFLANMSHEIRTPLHGILGIASVLESTALNSHQQQLLATIKNSGDYLLTTLNDVLDLTRAEEGQLKVTLGVHSPVRVLNHVTRLFEQPIKDKELDFIVDVSDNIPESVLMDQARVAQVVSNLVSNALKFTSHGSIAVSASWQGYENKKNEGELVVKVQDTGKGSTTLSVYGNSLSRSKMALTGRKVEVDLDWLLFGTSYSY